MLALLLLVCSMGGVSGEGADAAEDVEFRWPHHGSGDIVLDTRIRDWVLIPIFIIMVFFTMLREIGGRLMNATPKGDLTVALQTVKLPGLGVLALRARLHARSGGWGLLFQRPEGGTVWKHLRAVSACSYGRPTIAQRLLCLLRCNAEV